MPTILIVEGFRFFFYSNEGNEPPHIHVEKGDSTGKYWLDPVIEVYYYGFTITERRKIRKIIAKNQAFLKNKWNEYFG